MGRGKGRGKRGAEGDKNYPGLDRDSGDEAQDDSFLPVRFPAFNPIWLLSFEFSIAMHTTDSFPKACSKAFKVVQEWEGHFLKFKWDKRKSIKKAVRGVSLRGEAETMRKADLLRHPGSSLHPLKWKHDRLQTDQLLERRKEPQGSGTRSSDSSHP